MEVVRSPHSCNSALRAKTTAKNKHKEELRKTDYCVEIKTLCLASLGFCPAPVELHTRFAIRQFEHGDSLSQRI